MKFHFSHKSIKRNYSLLVVFTIVTILASLGCGRREEMNMIDATAKLNHLLKPTNRYEKYEDPLDVALRENKLGEVTGGGTMLKESGEIDYIDITMRLKKKSVSIPFVIDKLESLGAPKGSILFIYDNDPPREILFGKFECVSVSFDWLKIPKEIYSKYDLEHIIGELNTRIAPFGKMDNHWEGPTKTLLYFYGNNADSMVYQIKDFLNANQLYKDAEIIFDDHKNK